MALGVDQRALALRVGSPQQEHQAFALAIQCIDRSVSEALPAPVRMGAGTSLLHRQHAVEQQHAAVGPGGEATVAGTGHAEVALDLPEDVVQRWGYPHAAAHRKAQPMRLAGAVVGVLAQDHNPHRVDGLYDLVEVATEQSIELLGMMTESIHTPLLQDRF